ncbi:hypothetical protein MMC10_005839 [Thelotrema lepadinum]|nr:hypothetical protein [Thelotrema lepadinum]
MNIDYSKSRFSKFMRHVGLVLFCVLFPDFLFFRALQQLDTARWLRNEINRTLTERHKKDYASYVKKKKPSQESISKRPVRDVPDVLEKGRTEANPISSERGKSHMGAEPDPQGSSPHNEGVAKNHVIVPSKADTSPTTEPEQPSAVNKAATPRMETPLDCNPSPSDELEADPELWTLTHAFWVTANGFAVRLNKSNDGSGIVVLTSYGVVKLAELGLLPNLSAEEIGSRSKADEISKIIVTAQVLWYLVQLVGRAVSRLPILLVEIHSAANALYALLMYICWLPKCYQPDMAIFLENTEIVEVVAFFALQESQEMEHADSTTPDFVRKFGWFLSLAMGMPSIRFRGLKELPQRRDLAMKAEQRFAGVDSGKQVLDMDRVVVPYVQRYTVPPEGKHYIALPPAPIEDIHESTTKPYHFVIWLLCIPIYGAIHVAAWNTQFPSTLDQWLWRSAALVLAGSMNLLGVGLGIALMVHGTIIYLSGRWKDLNSQQFAHRLVEQYAVNYNTGTAIALGSSMLFARIVILFEVFFSLRRSPAGAYESVDWSSFFPHLGA